MNMEEYRQAGVDLYHRLHLPTYPVAITYIKSEDEIPETAVRPSALNQKWSICQAFTYARRWGWLAAMTADENFCVPASAMHKWVDVTDEDFIQSQVEQGWHQDRAAEEARFRFAQALYGQEGLEKAAQYMGLVCSPLAQAALPPDTVLIFGDGTHITHLAHALTYDYQQPVVSSFEGYGESCVKGGLMPFLTGRPQIVIPGMGDRAFAGIGDHEIGCSFPGSQLPKVLDNLFKSGGPMNMGQPVKTLMPTGLTESITPGFQYLRNKVDEQKNR